MANKQVNILIKFTDRAAALEWFDEAKTEGFVPDGSDLFKGDDLDLNRGGGPGTYLVKATTERAPRMALRHEG
jgi:hypothetical protein